MKHQVYIIAELSANHGGKLEIALETVRAAKRAGADAIKLQTFTAADMTLDVDSPEFMANPNGPWAGQSLFSLYEEAALPLEWHEPIFKLAKELGLDCFSSPFSINSVDFLEKFQPPAYKIASFEITDIPLIQYAASKHRPMIISTGVATAEDIQLAVDACKKEGNSDITILKCTSSYPSSPDEMDLLTMADIANRFQVKVGLSDHSMGLEAPIIATTLGATVIEKHFILHKDVGGPDASFSLTEKEFTEMVHAVRNTELMLGSVSYALSDKKKESRKRARSIYISEDVKKGDIVTSSNIKIIRPGFGLHPMKLESVLGKKFNENLPKGTPLHEDFLD